MQIHHVNGTSIRDALERARDEHGEQAVVLSQRSGAHGGVTLALADAAPRDADELARLRGRARELLARLPDVHRAPLPRPGTRDVERSLRAAGASTRLVDRVCEAVAGRLPEGSHPLDIAGEELGTVFPVARCKAAADACNVLAFLGEPGAGKTTTVVKLARRLLGAGRRVALVTLDGERPGAREQMGAIAGELGCPVYVARDAGDAARWLARERADVALLDTTGRLADDARGLDRLEELLAGEGPGAPPRLERYLVLPASSSREALERATAEARAGGCVITKLDRTARPGRVLEHAVRRKLPIAFLSDGPDVDGRFHRGCPERFADLMLKGRIA